jgi:hypothetical protein
MVGLSLALVLALLWTPVPPTLAEDSARIDAPANGANVVGSVQVRGRAVTSDPSTFSFYRLYYGAGSSAPSLRPIGSPSDQPVEDGVLGTWDTAPLFQGEYVLQLSVYDTSGNATMARVVVNVLPAPTPTPLNRNPVLVPVPGQTPEPEDPNQEPTATPLPEIPPLIPQIPQIDVPPPNQPPIEPVQPPVTDPNAPPPPINPISPPYVPPPYIPSSSDPGGAPPTYDPGPSALPTFGPLNPVNPVSPPAPPDVAPYVPPPTLELPPTPTQFGLPP